MELPVSASTPRDSLATEDGEVLRAVMAFLDSEEDPFAFDATPTASEGGSNSGSGGSDVESVADSTVSSLTSARAKRESGATRKPAASAPRVFNRSRVRRRHEVLSLREQVIALEERLEALQNGESTQEGSTTVEQEEMKKLRVAAWQAVAECQREQLTEAEEEREKLRGLIKDYKLTVKRIERFLSKQTFPGGLLDEDFSEPRTILADDADPDSGFEEISRNLPAMYMQINGVFSDSRFGSQVGGMRDIRVQNEETAHMSIEVLESRLLPFSIETTAKAVWHFHQIKGTKVASSVVEQLEETEHTMRRTLMAVLDIANHKGRARARIETRRFVEHDRVVILEHAVFDQTERIKGTAPDGYSMRQFHWTVIGPPRNERLQRSGRDVCQVETFEVTIPFLENPNPTRDAKKDQQALKEFVLETSKVIIEIERQAIENILMGLSLTDRT